MITLHHIAKTVLESATDVNDDTTIGDCRSILLAVKHGRALPTAEIARVKAIYAELMA